LKADQFNAAFDQAKPFLDDKKPSSARARARLVQAKVLALEFLNQSVKVKDPSRLEQILAYKIDKLDRAQTALLSVTRFGHPASSREAHLQLEAVYSHFIETIKNFPFPEGTDPGVRSALQNQFASILPEFQNKLEASKKILTISQAGEAKDLEEFLLGMETSSPPPPWLPQVTGEVFPQIEHKEKDLSRAQELLSRSETHAEGLLMLSLAAEKKGLLHKALWLVEEAVRRNPDYDMALYQKARLHALLFGFEVAKEHFRKSFVLTKSSPEKSLFSGLLAISDGDFVSTKRDLEKLPENLRYNEAVGLRLVEAELQLGNLSEADKHLKALEKKNPRSAAVLLQRARLEEGYRLSSSEAVRAWEKLLAQLQSSASQEKVKNKIEFLKAKQPRHVGTNN
ncbi:MAG: hypothetical protein N2578_08825, partial [Bdellovibrionaceae bacterium]|nr:hypothetical protein [Pseudobdellovibrionaceae bacterium]